MKVLGLNVLLQEIIKVRERIPHRGPLTKADWLSDLRTQLKAFVGGVCLRSKRFFLALFSRLNFLA